MEKKVTTPVIKGLIISLILVVFGLIIYFTNQMQNKALGFVQYCILIAGIIWGCIQYSKEMNGNVTFGNVFAHGFKITAFVIVVMVVYFVLATTVLFPDMIDKMVEQARLNMEKQNMPDQNIETGLTMMKKYFIPFGIGGIIVMFGILGAIASLIGAAAAKKNPQTPFNQ
ncbi:MAG: hypothetical protein JWN76_1463 [Chitinophagaceae bacterium]|nr:hypothetical protein [Chitinophagaceae bacterium]